MKTYRLNNHGFPVGCKHSFGITPGECIVGAMLAVLILFITFFGFEGIELIGAVAAFLFAFAFYGVTKHHWLNSNVSVEDISQFFYLLTKMPETIDLPKNIELDSMKNKELNKLVSSINTKLMRFNRESAIKNCKTILVKKAQNLDCDQKISIVME